MTTPETHAPDKDTLLPLAAFASTHITLPTLRRWCTRGQKVRGTGRVVVLQARRTPGRVLTCQRWLDDFLAHWNAGQVPEIKPVLSRQTEQAVVREELRRLGMKI
jgi:hypothetical protein